MYKTTVQIDGMSCSMCENHIKDTIRKTCSLKKVSTSAKKGTAEIISEDTISEDALRAALDPTGYRVLQVKSEAYKKKGLFG